MRISKRWFALHATLAAVLSFVAAVLLSRAVDQRVRPPVRLSQPTLQRLEAIRGQVLVTYFASGRDAMPSSMKDVADGVQAVLAAMKAAAPDRIGWRVIDPDADPLGPAYAAKHGASPVRVRRVLEDESSEAAVWSSLVLAWERHPDGLIQGVMPADVPYLEAMIVETLAGAESPKRPTIAIAAPERGYEQLRTTTAALVEAEVVPVRFDPGIRIPEHADLLIWVHPRGPAAADADALREFLESGRSVILAGSSYAIDPVAAGARTTWRASRAPAGWHDLLRAFGLAQETRLLLDRNHAEIAWRSGGGVIKADAPFQIRVLPSSLDTRTLLGPNTGVLLVSSVGALRWDAAALAAAGRRAVVLATTSEHATATEIPEGDFDDSRLEGAVPVPKQPWLVRLASDDPWKGDLVVAGSPILFNDDAIAQGMNANQPFTRTLLRTFLSQDRLARIRVPRRGPDRIAPLSLPARLSWRVVTVFLVPAVLLAFALVSRRAKPLAASARRPSRALAGIAAFAGVLAAAALVGAAIPARADLTEGKVNTPSESTTRRLDALRGDVFAELVASESFRVPPALKRVEPRVLAALREHGVRAAIIRPEDLSDADRKALADSGVAPFDVRAISNDAESDARAWSALRLRHAGRTEVIPRLDQDTVEHLDFLLASAFERLATGRAPVVAVLSDLPRLSPAEAHDYSEKGYTAPVGSDVYADVKRLLADYGYRVVYVNPDTQQLPEAMDVLLWIQPRFAQKALPRFSEHLAGGGRALVALQHYNVLQRQWRGSGFKTVYWPQPQFHRFNDYLELIGVRQLGEKRNDPSGEIPGEVLFDRQHSDLVLKTEVRRTALGETDLQQVSRPFLIRAAGAGLAADSPITARLSGLQFIWGSRFAIDPAKASGVASRTLVATSPRAWTYAWSGGNIPDASFEEPETFLPGPQPLAVLLEGRFPRVSAARDEQGRDVLKPVPDDAPASASSRPFRPAPGKLLLVGSSQMFKNEHLREPGYQHDQFLLNAIAFLAWGPELAEVQARAYAPRMLGFQPAPQVLRWRLVTLALPPLAFILLGIAGRIVAGVFRRRRAERLARRGEASS
jgi:hypothetical protein